MMVSVLIPYYNDREYLSQAIESVLNQTYKDFELILINHATTDDCREIAHSYNDKRIKHIDMEENYGAGGGMIISKFLENAKGKYVKFFCADDVMYPNCLEDLVTYMEKHPEKDFVFGDVEYIDENNKSLKNSYFKSRFGFSTTNTEIDCIKNFFLGLSFLPYIGSFAKREIFKNIEINKSFIMLLDMSIWLSLLINGYKIGYLNKYIGGYRIHEFQMCNSKSAKTIYQRSSFESFKFFELFYQIKDIELLKKIFNNNKFLINTKNITTKDIKFIIAFEMLIHNIHPLRMQGYSYICNLLNNDIEANYLKEKFNFGIKEFRQIYSRGTNSLLASVKNLSLRQIFYLLIKKILLKISLKEFFDKKKKNIL